MSRLGTSLVALFLANAAAVVLIWWSGLDARSLDDPAGRLNAAGRVTALVGTYLVLVQLLLRTHVPWLVSAFGKDALKIAHTRNAYAVAALLVAHTVLQLAGYALEQRADPVTQLVDLLVHYEGVLLATFGLGVLLVLTILSLDTFRHRVAWPVWRALHLFLYVAVALSVPHQLATGSDFVDAPLAVAYWTALLAVTLAVTVAAAAPRAWAGARARVGGTGRLTRPHAATLGVAATVLGMYLIGSARLAPDVRTAAAAPAPSPRALVSSPPGTPAPAASGALVSGAATVLGDVVETPYGEMQVRILVQAGRIEDVEMVLMPEITKRSRTISLSVDPWLRRRAIAAQSADFDVISGATYTSLAYMRSLESAVAAPAAERR